MAQHISRPAIRAIQLRSQHRPQIPNADLHGVCGGALRLAADVDSGPAEDQGDGGIDTACGEEDAGVGDARVGARILVREQDYVSDDRERGGG